VTPDTVQAAVAPVEAGVRGGLAARVRRVLPFLGPAFVASVAYMDPGNFATNVQAGADYGYMLLWVLLASNLMAILIQSLSAKLGIASGMTLPQAIRANTGRRTNIGLWLAAEAAAMATDLAEFLGAAVGMHLLFGLSLFPSALLTAVASFAILAIEGRGHTRLEALIIAFVAIIGSCFFVEIFIADPDPAGILRGAFVPHMQSSAVYVAVGMVGATVMPHCSDTSASASTSGASWSTSSSR
jgi:manganese transport protein